MFKALYLSRVGDQFDAQLTALDDAQLPQFDQGGVTLDVAYSTINYKDALALTNRSPVVRKWPMVPGIDGAGVVSASAHPEFEVGQTVVLNGFGVGEVHWGCLAERARLNGDWLVALPAALSPRQAMAIGTAGYTAMLCVLALEDQGVTPGAGEVLVTGATGGVGSVAVALLSHLGYQVCASTGKVAEEAYLKELGAQSIIERSTLASPGKPLQKERFAAVVDAVGSHTLVNACAQVRYGGVVTACGLAQGMDFPASVAPFILRSVRLIGVDSVNASKALRIRAWRRLASDLEIAKLDLMTRQIGLEEALAIAPQLLAGSVRGRIVVDVRA